MKIAVISDMHLGYGEGTDREEDAYRQADEAVEKALEKDVDLILLPGDIFDGKTPKPETWSRALRILKKPLMKKGREVKIKEPQRGKEKLSQSGVPVIAIHGTHERRSKGYVNPIEMLEDAGYLIHLHCEKARIQVNGEEIAIHGMSGVPEKHAKTVLEKYNPKPVKGISNVFMFHQSLEEYVYDPENTFLQAGDLPDGFDLHIDGHIHWHNVLEDGKTVLFPGSTMMTQMRKIESEKDKGFYVIDTENWNREFISLETQRQFKYLELEFDGEGTSEIVGKAREKLKQNIDDSNERKPLIKLKLKGTVSNEAETSVFPIDEVKEDFDALIDIDREFEGKGFKNTIEDLRESQREKKSIRDMGMDALKDMLSESKYDSIDPEEMMNLLSEKDPSQIVDRIMEEQEEPEEQKEDKREIEGTSNRNKTLKDF